MSDHSCNDVTISHLQFHLSRILDEATRSATPFTITKRHRRTHLVLPLSIVTDAVIDALGLPGGVLRGCAYCPDRGNASCQPGHGVRS